MLFALVVLVISRVDAFVNISPIRISTTKCATIEEEGLHGSDFCFMPLEQLDNEVRWYRFLFLSLSFTFVVRAGLACFVWPDLIPV